MSRTDCAAASRVVQLTAFVLFLPRQNQLGQYIEHATTFGNAVALGLLAAYHFGLEFEGKHAPLQLLFLDAFQYVILVACFR